MSETINKVISVNYNLHKDTEKGEMIESTDGKEPLVFLSGVGQMIPDFEANVANLKVGEEFSFSINAANAYGTRSDDAIIELEKEMFLELLDLKYASVFSNIGSTSKASFSGIEPIFEKRFAITLNLSTSFSISGTI